MLRLIRRFAHGAALFTGLLGCGALAVAQDARLAQTARSSVGQVGQRQTRAQAAASIQPMGRIATRIDNRIQSRLHSRIDPTYDANDDAAAQLKLAGAKAGVGGRLNRR